MSTASSAPVSVFFEGVCPILRVESASKSIRYYVEILGFKIDWQYPEGQNPFIASVSRGKCHIFLSEGDQGNPGAWVWIGVEDADALLAEYHRTGAKIRHPPTNYPWAREMQVEDLDGNVLRLGSAPRNEATGEWLDMEGRRWLPRADGGWKRAEQS
jgi:predicted enzyme related to lactoylglutathione lyase